jgi:hypothetical protein
MKNSNLPAFFSRGKIDVDFEIQEGFILGVCSLYPERSAGNGEYMIREKSVVVLDQERGLSTCAQEAKDLAYSSVTRRLMANNVLDFPVFTETANQPQAEDMSAQGNKDASGLALVSSNQEELSENQQSATNVDGGSSIDDNDADEKAQRVEAETLIPVNATAQKEQDPGQTEAPVSTAEESDDEGMTYNKALSAVITICGKAHDMYNHTAGEILNNEPELIVYLATRGTGANGAKANEYAAVKTLYNDAVERVDKKSA